jgi:parallel beta-helix repeat protein
VPLATLKRVIAILLLLLLSVPIHLSSSQTSTSDWIITGTEVVENTNISLDGSLIIKSGGSLILRNITLTLNVQYNGQHGISVEEGGSLFIYNCNISSTTENRFSFVAGGSSFVMRNSELRGVGWCSFQNEMAQSCLIIPDEVKHSGLMVVTDQAIIEDNVFSGNAIGLILAGSNITVARNLFSYNTVFSIVVYNGHHDNAVNNTLLQNPATFGTSIVQLWGGAENNTFFGNTLIENVTFIEYHIQGFARMDGFNLDSSHGNVFVNNSITVLNIPVFLIRSDDSVIIGNKMNYGEMAVNIITGVNTRIEGNDMNALPGDPSIFQPYAAIIATQAHNSIMANNTITGRVYTGICLGHTSNSSILNNNISLTRPGRLGTMVFVGSRNNSVIGNTMSGSEFGMILTGSSDGNLITRNNVFTDHSISIMGSSSNLIFLNNLYDFKEPSGGPYDNGINFWYSGEDGNYWSHFTSRNAEGNGVGDEPYSRSIIPPNGTEPFSLLVPAEITSSPIPQMKPIPKPKVGSNFIPLDVISNQVMEIGWGDFPDNLTIINSTLFLGKEGLVRMGGSVSIINSRLINMGYGFSPWGSRRPRASSLLIKNSTIEGAFLDDVDVDNITIIDSKILNSMGVWGISVARAYSIVIVNSTISGGLGGINTYSDLRFYKCLFSGNRIYDVIDYGIFGTGPQTGNITIADNTVVGCNMGTGIALGGFSIVRENNITNVRLGLDTSGAGNILYENNIVNTLYPVQGGALIYHNNFVNYSYPPYENQFHVLSFNGEGNYWSNYTGKDMNFDGLGDTPLMISGGGALDRYPFMKPNGWLTAFWLNVTTNLPSIPFKVNGTSFSTDPNGRRMMRLGYAADYAFSFPAIIETAQSRFSLQSLNGTNSNELIIYLSSNATVTATYAIGPSTTVLLLISATIIVAIAIAAIMLRQKVKARRKAS